MGSGRAVVRVAIAGFLLITGIARADSFVSGVGFSQGLDGWAGLGVHEALLSVTPATASLPALPPSSAAQAFGAGAFSLTESKSPSGLLSAQGPFEVSVFLTVQGANGTSNAQLAQLLVGAQPVLSFEINLQSPAIPGLMTANSLAGGPQRTVELAVTPAKAPQLYMFELKSPVSYDVNGAPIYDFTEPIPEPSTLALFAAGLGLVGWRAWRMRTRD